MANAKQIVAVVVAATVLVTLFGPTAGVIATNTGQQSVGNEQVTADIGNWSDVDGYDVIENSVTVEAYDSTTDSYETVSEGTDYEFDYEQSRLKPLAGGSIDDGDTLRVSYDYQATDGVTATIIELIPLLMAVVGIVLFSQHMDV